MNTRLSHRAAAPLIALAITLLALTPRVLGLADFITIDESYHWIGRVERFSAAIAAGDWAQTNQTGHPGVTTMWLGAIGQWFAAMADVTNPGWAGGGVLFLAYLRLPLAIVNGLAVGIGYLLLRRLLAPGTATLAAVFWALSPFLIAHSRLLHLDALLTSFSTLSILLLLAALGRWNEDRSHWQLFEQHDQRFLIGSGFCAGLALLTKAPALLLPPFAALLLGLALLWRARGNLSLATLLSGVRHALPLFMLWLGSAAVTMALLWPAIWVDPAAALGSILREIIDNGAQPHHSGNYFLGQAVGDPGPLFYFTVLLWRATPLTFLGAEAAIVMLFAAIRRANRDTIAAIFAPLGALALFSGLFLLAMSLQAKKFDRYLLPVWPALEILAAAGIIWLIRWRGAALLCTLLLGIQIAWFHPYYLGYFNPAFGGGEIAEEVMLVGWGEGMEQVGAWLSERPDLSRGPVLSWIPPTLAPFVPKDVLVLDLREGLLRQPSSYAVLYARSVQRNESAVAEAYVRQTPPLYTISIHGADYAAIHQLPRPFDIASDVTFGDGIHLRGYSQERSANTLVITPSWSITADQPGGAVVFVHLLNDQGARVAQVDAPLDQQMFADWQAGQQFDAPLPLPLPADLPAGDYRLVLGVYRPESGARLALNGGPALPEGIAGPHAFLLGTVTLP